MAWDAGIARAARRHLEDVGRRPVGAEDGSLDPRSVGGLDDHGARSVAEEDRGRAVREVEDPAEDLRARQEDRVGHPRLHERRGAREAVAEAGARRVHVERRHPDAKLLLGPDGGRGERRVARDARDDDQVELIRA